MSGIYVFLSIITAILFILTRDSVLKIKKADVFTIEIHSIFLAIVLTQREKYQSSDSLDGKSFLSVRRALLNILPHADITLHSIRISDNHRSFGKSTFTRPYRYHIALSTFIAYLEMKAQKLTVDADAITFVSDSERYIEFSITARIMLFHLLFELIKLFYVIREKRKEQKDVRIQNG